MGDVIVLVWVGFIFFAAVFFASISIVHLFKKRKIGFDKGFLFSLSACVAAVMLCLSIWPPLHRVYDDEPTYISQSVNILSLGKASITIMGSRLRPEAFDAWTSNPKFPGFAWAEAVLLFLTKDFEHSYFILNIVLGALSVAAVYRIAWLWSASYGVAWWSAIFFACLPVRITYSMSAASDIAGLFFFLLFLLFISEYGSQQSKRILYAALFCGIYSICIKQFYVIPILLGLAAALYIYRRNGSLDRKLYSQILLDAVCLFLPILAAIPVFLFSDSMKGGYSFAFIFKNLCTSISYLFSYKQSTFLTAWAALAAVGRSIFYKRDNPVIGLAGWLLTGILLNSMFYAGGFSYPGAAYSDRYFLPLALPFVFLAAKGMVDIFTRFWSRLLSVLFFILLLVNASFASNQLVAQAKNAFDYKETLLLKQVLPLVPDEAYMMDRSAVLVTMISSKKTILTDLFLRGHHPEKVVFLKGISDVIYDYYNTKEKVSADNILNTAYRCKPLTGSPLKEADLSATPFLCTRK